MRVALVSMPFHSLEVPSSAFGALRPSLEEAGHDVVECYGGLWFAEHLHAATGGTIGAGHYEQVSNQFEHATGDWVFAGALSGRARHGDDFYLPYLRQHGVDPEPALRMREHVADFLAVAAQRVLAARPDAVACTSTFMQNVPTLALAAELKRRAPGLPVLLGGGNCDGVQGSALLRAFDQIDYVVSGEGEHALPQLLEVVTGARHPGDVAGLHWRDPVGQVISNPPGALVPFAQLPAPDYRAYFEEIDRSPLRSQVRPKLVLEAARGCWWGEKHHCTFCGLNGTTMAFRSKPAEVLLGQLEDLVVRHRCLDVVMVDNIMDSRYTREFLPALAERAWDLRVHWEVKSNLTAADIEAFRAAGVHQIQPGIESLSSHVLKLMRKGVTGPQNVGVLRECESAGLTVTWNLLFGFPGERTEDYRVMLGQLDNLVHLQPPGAVERLLLERFSPYFDDPDLGFPDRSPAEIYRHLYDVDEQVLQDLVYLFDAPQAGIGAEVEDQLRAAVERWSAGYPASTLSVIDRDGTVIVREGRAGRPPGAYHLDPDAGRVLVSLARPRRRAALGADERIGLAPAEVDAALEELRERGLVYVEEDTYVGLGLAPGPRSWVA